LRFIAGMGCRPRNIIFNKVVKSDGIFRQKRWCKAGQPLKFRLNRCKDCSVVSTITVDDWEYCDSYWKTRTDRDGGGGFMDAPESGPSGGGSTVQGGQGGHIAELVTVGQQTSFTVFTGQCGKGAASGSTPGGGEAVATADRRAPPSPRARTAPSPSSKYSNPPKRDWTEKKKQGILFTGQRLSRRQEAWMDVPYSFYRGDRFLIGYIDGYPQYPTQGKNIKDLEKHLLEIYRWLRDGSLNAEEQKGSLRVTA
jgi:hypothetical protein